MTHRVKRFPTKAAGMQRGCGDYVPGRMSESTTALDLLDAWALLTPEERAEGFRAMSRDEQDDFFLSLQTDDQAELFRAVRPGERRLWARLLAPDDVADLAQYLEGDPLRDELLSLLDEATRNEVSALLAYEEDEAGGLMSPRFARLRPDSTIDQALFYLRRQARSKEHALETLHYAYVLDGEQRLLGVLSFRDVFAARENATIESVMTRDVVTVHESMDQEEVARIIAEHDLSAVPVVDDEGRMKGIITVDDIVDVVQQEATEDIQKIGGQEALEQRYMQTSLPALVKKRAGWLALLFLGETLTTTAMGAYEEEIASAVVLALFVPLIISSGGNSGSQASTLIIRAMALGEVGMRDWWRIAHRELLAGIALGGILAVIGVARVALGEALFGTYGEHWLRIGMTVGISLLGVVVCGTIAGSMLPFVIRLLRADPASASAPFVATLVDLAGLVVYFNVAQWLLRGTLL